MHYTSPLFLRFSKEHQVNVISKLPQRVDVGYPAVLVELMAAMAGTLNERFQFEAPDAAAALQPKYMLAKLTPDSLKFASPAAIPG